MRVDLVVGLGNPGRAYAATRHNVGFRVVETVARRLGAGRWKRRHLSRLACADSGRPVWIAKPRTYMNRSGAALSALLDGLELPVEALIVVVDDVDLPLGRLRLRARGGPGTHNGLRDVCDRVGTGYARLRVGVRGEAPWEDLAEYVTAPFHGSEVEMAESAIETAADAVVAVLDGDLGAAMSRFNRREP